MGFAAFFILLAVATAPALAGYYFRYDEDVQGKVIDADTQQPLEGVVVMAMWFTEHTRITIEPEERYYDYFETLTDANGEFTIPGKGRNIFRNMPPPKITIYKAGYPIRDTCFRVMEVNSSYPWDVKVTLKDGKRFILYKKLTPAKRKEYVKHYMQVPYSKMAHATVPRDKYRLYSAELASDYQALGMTPPHERDHRYLRYKKGGVYPATNQPVSPRNSQ
jgi:hypothetical protein